MAKNNPRNKWDRMARTDFTPAEMDRYHELSGKLQYTGGLSPDEADRQALLEMKGVNK